MVTNLLVLAWVLRYFWKWGNIIIKWERICWNRKLRFFCTLFILLGFQDNSTYVLAKTLQNGPNLYKKLTPDLKNHRTNFGNFKQTVESPKIWNLIDYFCPKNAFHQLKHFIQRIYPTLLSTFCVKIHQMTYVIFETISYFSRHSPSIFFQLKYYILPTKISYQIENFQTFHWSHYNSRKSSYHFWNQEPVFLQTLTHSSWH